MLAISKGLFFSFCVIFFFHTKLCFSNTLQFAIPYYLAPESKNWTHFLNVKAAFETQGITVIPISMPIAQIEPHLEDNTIQLAFLENPKTTDHLFASDAYVYRLVSVAVSLEENKITINSPSDLKFYYTVAFQNASKLLGPEFQKITQNNPRYLEKANQENQVSMLYIRRAQVIIIADSIFEYYKAILPQHLAKIPTRVDYFLGKEGSPVKVVFKDLKLKETFDRGMHELEKRSNS